MNTRRRTGRAGLPRTIPTIQARLTICPMQRTSFFICRQLLSLSAFLLFVLPSLGNMGDGRTNICRSYAGMLNGAFGKFVDETKADNERAACGLTVGTRRGVENPVRGTGIVAGALCLS